MSFSGSDSWTILSPIEQSIKRKIETVGVPLRDWDVSINYGIKTGLNEAFIIDGAKKDELIAADPKSAEIIRPILRGRDIKRYGYTFADLWLIASHNGIKEQGIPRININDYPAIKTHLDQYYKRLATRSDKGDTPYNLRNCVYMDDFSKQKIAYAETMRVHKSAYSDRFPRFSFVEEGFFHDKTCFIITGDNLYYLLAVMNSRITHYFASRNIAVLDTGGFLMQKIYVELLPIPVAPESIRLRLEQLCRDVITLRKEGLTTEEEENEIDNIIFKLFNFSTKEIEFINEALGIS